LETARGTKRDAELLPSSLVNGRVLVLNFRLADGSRRSRALFGDEVDADALRRLRARLLTGQALAKPDAKAD
ncbi:MAG TPA: hypothetical protein VFK72_09410, partial [Nevskia sp.]|nr:hypothetical protein [Nevskia sp.]